MRALRRAPPAFAFEGLRIGYLELLVLLLARRRGPLPGIAMLRVLVAADYRTTPGSLYKAVHQLEEKGLLSHSVAPPRDIPGGRARMMFTMTERGREALESALALVDQLR